MPSATTLSEVREAVQNLRKYLRHVEKYPKSILTKEATRLQREAKSEAPRKTGKLSRSVRASVSKSAKGATLNISASARSKSGYDYSAIQHESTKFRHKVGKANYLIDPYNRSVSRIEAELQKRMKPPGGGKR